MAKETTATDGQQWHCPLCETWNAPSSAACEACDEPRPADAATRAVERPAQQTASPQGSSIASPAVQGSPVASPSSGLPLGAERSAAGEGSSTDTPAGGSRTSGVRWWVPPLVAIVVVLLVLLGIEVGILISNGMGS